MLIVSLLTEVGVTAFCLCRNECRLFFWVFFLGGGGYFYHGMVLLLTFFFLLFVSLGEGEYMINIEICVAFVSLSVGLSISVIVGEAVFSKIMPALDHFYFIF